ncbi:hypothetical protein, conserved [Plasmodium gonderi]|uniref:Zinc finger protein n=1 Tax=Plasmodium gonderi TaxID=77519 RepID=A0A1Y1JM25_PLAGO|nr:hypothetical protein, conserved [Plasmodium gonderi]GAW82648.1 hypothetical protein, conserved [Plasmodium gonderi]
MFRKRTINNLKNRKKTEDIENEEEENEDNREVKKSKREEDPKDITSNGTEEKGTHEKKYNLNKGKSINDNDDSVDDVVCKFLFKKKLKKLNEESNLHLKRKRKLMIQSENENKEENNITEDRIYKGDFSVSKNYGSYEIDQDSKNDYRARMERNIEIGEEILKGNLKDNVYRGKDAHEKSLMMSKDSLAKNKYTGLYGPIRNSGANVRMTLRIDYEPCICKDYKETGYCGFGDTCIYLHDRSDYKSGWKIEQEYEEKRKRNEALRKEKLEKWNEKMLRKLKEKEEKTGNYVDDDGDNGKEEKNEHGPDNKVEKSSHSPSVSSGTEKENSSDSESSDDENNLPFACIKCKKKWRLEMNPSVTECFHYFCEKCFIQMFQKNKKCFKCGLQLNGIMNVAHNIVDILNKKKLSK